MRRFDFFIAVILLLQTGFAAACHNVGDVHVICHDDGIKTVYVERSDKSGSESHQAQLDSGDDAMLCCNAVMAGETPSAYGLPLNINRPHKARPSPPALTQSLRVATPPTRGPPVFSAL